VQTQTTHPEDLLSVSAAARLLGVSVSSLRAWAAAGQVPHRRTRGGHRRFERAELERWLAARGGELPAAPTRPAELVPTRVQPLPTVAEALRGAATGIVTEAEHQMDERGAASRRRAGARRERLHDAITDLADAFEGGDLGPCLREAEWQGFRHGAAGVSAEQPLGEALALARAVECVLTPELGGPSAGDVRSLRQTLDRSAYRVATGYAAGLRSRRRVSDDG
jgi:excisionase family DNA binding protein